MNELISMRLAVGPGRHPLVPAKAKHRAHVVGWDMICDHDGTRFLFYTDGDEGKQVTGEFPIANAARDNRLLSGPIDAPPAPIVSSAPSEGLDIKSLSGSATLNGVVQVWYSPSE